jgi:hypothetical protein
MEKGDRRELRAEQAKGGKKSRSKSPVPGKKSPVPAEASSDSDDEKVMMKAPAKPSKAALVRAELTDSSAAAAAATPAASTPSYEMPPWTIQQGALAECVVISR